MSQILVLDMHVDVIEYRGQRVVTPQMIADLHKLDASRVRQNLNYHRERFIEGEDYFKLEGQELQEFKRLVGNSYAVNPGTSSLTLFTEGGYLLLVKTFTDDRSWDLQRAMRDSYFTVRQIIHAEQQQILPVEIADRSLRAWLSMGEMLGVPKRNTMIEAGKHIRRDAGINIEPLLLQSPEMNNVPADELYKEPTELARRLGVKSPIEMNKILERLGLQTKINKEWRPTEKGKPICYEHEWVNKNKSGQNLKWNIEQVQEMMNAGN